MLKTVIATLGTVFISAAAYGQALPVGDKVIYLHDQSGARHPIASIQFAPAQDGSSSYSLSIQDAGFGDYFLSMRPFQCLEGAQKHWCYVPYPYENARTIRADDLTDLEYDLLFIWKGATEYGINMWNGVYYDLDLRDGTITGTLSEMSMDVLSVPPAPENTRPIRSADIHPADPDSHWLPFLVIE